MAPLFPPPKPKQERRKSSSLPFSRIFCRAPLRAGKTTPIEAVSAAPVLTPGDEERDGKHPEADFPLGNLAALADAALKQARVGIVEEGEAGAPAPQPVVAHEVQEEEPALLDPAHLHAG